MTGLFDIQQHPMFNTPAWAPLQQMSLPQSAPIPQGQIPPLPPQPQQGGSSSPGLLDAGLGLAGAGLLANNIFGGNKGLLNGASTGAGLLSRLFSPATSALPAASSPAGGALAASGFGPGVQGATGLSGLAGNPLGPLGAAAGIGGVLSIPTFMNALKGLTGNTGFEASTGFKLGDDGRVGFNATGIGSQADTSKFQPIADEINRRLAAGDQAALAWRDSGRPLHALGFGEGEYHQSFHTLGERGDQGTMMRTQQSRPLGNDINTIVDELFRSGFSPAPLPIPQGYREKVYKPGENAVIERVLPDRR